MSGGSRACRIVTLARPPAGRVRCSRLFLLAVLLPCECQ